MSGIDKIKHKAKLSLDEMFDNQSVGLMENQEVVNPGNKQHGQPANHMIRQQDNHTLNQTNRQTDDQQNGKVDNHFYLKPDNQTNIQSFPIKKQQTQKEATYKMTFNLREEIYKSFNDLYAQRMLQGRKTEKSEMICEAIQWLIKMDKEQEYNS
jgi:ABC-type Zn2+ transport system substrate-binding protein/surface adhesin